MGEPIVLEDFKERVILVGVSEQDGDDAEDSLAELAGLDAVKDVLQEMLREDKIYIERVIPYAQAGVLQLVRNKGELVSEEYVPEGISIRAYVPMEVYGKL